MASLCLMFEGKPDLDNMMSYFHIWKDIPTPSPAIEALKKIQLYMVKNPEPPLAKTLEK